MCHSRWATAISEVFVCVEDWYRNTWAKSWEIEKFGVVKSFRVRSLTFSSCVFTRCSFLLVCWAPCGLRTLRPPKTMSISAWLCRRMCQIVLKSSHFAWKFNNKNLSIFRTPWRYYIIIYYFSLHYLFIFCACSSKAFSALYTTANVFRGENDEFNEKMRAVLYAIKAVSFYVLEIGLEPGNDVCLGQELLQYLHFKSL